MTQIVTAAQSPSNAIRAHNHPVLEEGNLSYPDGRYTVDLSPGSDRTSFTLKHQIEGAPLIALLLKEKRAKYVCTVSSPISAYRRDTRLRRGHPRNPVGYGRPWRASFVYADDSVHRHLPIWSSSRTGTVCHSLWNGVQISLQQGSRLSLGHVIQLRSSIFNLLLFSKKDDLREGTFFVEAETEPFLFRVNLSPELHKFLQFASGGQTREHIMTHIVTACFALLQREFPDDNEEEGGWQTHRNLLALAEFLENRGLPHWSDSDNFHPEHVATAFVPSHPAPREDDGDED